MTYPKKNAFLVSHSSLCELHDQNARGDGTGHIELVLENETSGTHSRRKMMKI
jgi:hypothetical protein